MNGYWLYVLYMKVFVKLFDILLTNIVLDQILFNDCIVSKSISQREVVFCPEGFRTIICYFPEPLPDNNFLLSGTPLKCP